MTNSEIAVIFDMDGVLVDTFEAHFESWNVVARQERTEMTRQQFAKTFGRTSREIIACLWPEKADDPVAVRDFDDRKEGAFRQIVAQKFPPMPGVGELLTSLASHGILMAVGSSGPSANVALVVEKLGAAELFGALITGDDVARGKPDPQVFLLAAERLGVPAERCIVVEDAQAGVEAARAAGMRCVGFASTGRTRAELAGADLVVDSLTELTPAVFRWLVEKP
jgi:beta-phosphoglucomutase